MTHDGEDCTSAIPKANAEHSRTLIRMIGLLGMMLPFVLLFGNYLAAGQPMKYSISAYYHTDMGYLFVGIMLATGAFLICYRSVAQDADLPKVPLIPNKRVPLLNNAFTFQVSTPDDKFTSLSGALAILVAVLPSDHYNVPEMASKAHLIAAALFLLTMAAISYLRFAREDSGDEMLHYICAGFIAVSVVVLCILVPLKVKLFHNWVWWFETIAVSAFGFSWLVAAGLISGWGRWATVGAVLGLFAVILCSPVAG